MSKAQEEKKVKDLLIPLTDYPHLPYWASLKEAVVQLTVAQQGLQPGERRRTVLVFDEAYKLQGILTERDILRGVEPKFASKYHEAAQVQWENLITAPAQAQLKKPIKDFMSPVGAKVGQEENLMKASHLMLQEKVDLIPVMEGNRVKGVVRLEDIFHEISKAILSV